MSASTHNRLLASILLFVVAAREPVSAGTGLQRDLRRLASVKQWKAELVVTSDCDRTGADGSRTIIHNRIATNYDFTRRLGDASTPKWSGRALTTYRWSVGTEFRGTRDVEESAASFESDGTLVFDDSTRIVSGRVPGRPFTRRRYAGDVLIESSTSDDEPPVAELSQAPLPPTDGTMSGSRMEEGYALLGGLLLPCPAQRQWTIRASS